MKFLRTLFGDIMPPKPEVDDSIGDQVRERVSVAVAQADLLARLLAENKPLVIEKGGR